MKICKNGLCPVDNVEKCCAFCDKQATCKDCCGNFDKTNCEDMQEVETNVASFQSKEVALINTITQIEAQKALISKKSDEMRAQLLAAMEQYGVKKFENDVLSVTYVAPTTRTSIDSTKLKKEMPEVAEKYSKTSNVKASIKITVKGD